MARSFRSNTFYKVVSLSSREDFVRPDWHRVEAYA